MYVQDVSRIYGNFTCISNVKYAYLCETTPCLYIYFAINR